MSLPSLNERIAGLLGWEQRKLAVVDGQWMRVSPDRWSTWFDASAPTGSQALTRLPDFEHSLDALQVAEKVLKARGAWELTSRWFLTFENQAVYEARWSLIGTRTHGVAFRGATEAEARALAVEAALTALNAESAS